MAALRFADIRFRATEFLYFTCLTLDEFQILVPPFEAAFQAHMTGWRLDGAPRTARRFTVYPRLFNAMERPGLRAGYRCPPEQRGSGPGWLCWSCLT